MATSPARWRALFTQAIVGGLVAGTIMLLVARFAGWIPDIAWGNALTQYVASIGWAAGYAYLAGEQGFLSKRWPVSGLMFGIMVYVMMALVLIGAGKFVWPQTATEWSAGIITDALCFGLPLAATIALLERTQQA